METNILLQHILPKEMTEYFEITGIKEDGSQLIFSLDEKNIHPSELAGKPIESKGFFTPIRILDFPIRGKPVTLEIRKRKWRDKLTGENYSKKWELTAKGTSYTKEFATFLKVLVR